MPCGYTAAMNTTATPALNDEDYEALDQILDDLRQRMDEVPQWEFCEGFMAALICSRRPIDADEYFGALLSDPATGSFGPALFASPARPVPDAVAPPLERSGRRTGRARGQPGR
jgi:hypothetical protein